MIHEFTYKRVSSGPMLATIRIEFDEDEVRAIRGNAEDKDQLASDIIAAAEAIAGNHSGLVHYRCFESETLLDDSL